MCIKYGIFLVCINEFILLFFPLRSVLVYHRFTNARVVY